jgi:hypothetical protein
VSNAYLYNEGIGSKRLIGRSIFKNTFFAQTME